MIDSKQYIILNNSAVNGAGNSIDCRDFRHAVVFVATSGLANLTLRFRGSIGAGVDNENIPDFNAAQSITNMWDNIEVIDLESGVAVRGDTGIILSGTDDFRIFQVNTDALLWLTAVVSARTAGNVSVKVMLFNE